MPIPCSVCAHPKLAEINQALRNGTSLRKVARQYDLSKDAVSRHKRHVSLTLAELKDTIDSLPEPGTAELTATDLRQGATYLEQITALHNRASSLSEKAEKAGDFRAAIGGVREIRGCLELMGKVLGDLPTGPMIGILYSPEWIAVRTAILRALEPFPDARDAVVQALDRIPPSPPPVPYCLPAAAKSRQPSIDPVRLSDRIAGKIVTRTGEESNTSAYSRQLLQPEDQGQTPPTTEEVSAERLFCAKSSGDDN